MINGITQNDTCKNDTSQDDTCPNYISQNDTCQNDNTYYGVVAEIRYI